MLTSDIPDAPVDMVQWKVNILMPVYKPDPVWLERALYSLVHQSESSWQLILSLDGNHPETLRSIQIASSIIPQEQLICVFGDHTGITGALNRGLKHCSSPFLARLDADDICVPDRLKSQLAEMEKNINAVAVGMQVVSVDYSEKYIRSRQVHYPSSYFSLLLFGMIINTPISHPVLFARTDAIKSIGNYRNYSGMEDYDLISRLCLIGEVYNLKSIGIHYRVHSSQITSSSRISRFKLLEVRFRFAIQLLSLRPFYFPAFILPLVWFLLGPRTEKKIRRAIILILNNCRVGPLQNCFGFAGDDVSAT